MKHDRDNPQYQVNLTESEKFWLTEFLRTFNNRPKELDDLLEDLQTNNLITLDEE